MEPASKSDAKAPRLLDQVRGAIARKHYSRRTEHACVASPLDVLEARG